jgi:hypothetical protein
MSLWYLAVPLAIGLPFGWDAVVYTHAAAALVGGTDPWLTRWSNISFGAPPPSLIPYVPFIWLPDAAIATLWIGISALSAIYIIRRLRLPWFWLMFPPITLGVAGGSGAVLCVALLVRGGVVGEAFAVATRVYAVIPLVVRARWRSMAWSIAVLVVTAPFLGWPTYVAARDRVAAMFEGQTANLSSFAAVWLIPVAVVCLVLLGRARAAWLAVPAGMVLDVVRLRRAPGLDQLRANGQERLRSTRLRLRRPSASRD